MPQSIPFQWRTLVVLLLIVSTFDATEVEVTLLEPSGIDRVAWPVSSGIPLAQGALRDPQASALYTADGIELPLQTEALARWPDGSIRWLLLDFQIDLKVKEKKTLTLRAELPLRQHREARTPVDSVPTFLVGRRTMSENHAGHRVYRDRDSRSA